MRVGVSSPVVYQWHSTGGSSQMCPGFDFRPFHFPLFLPTWGGINEIEAKLSDFEPQRKFVFACLGNFTALVN